MLYRVNTRLPGNIYLSLYAIQLGSSTNLFCKTLRFNFWIYSIVMEENYYSLYNNSLLLIHNKLPSSVFSSVQHVLACSLKSSVFKWRFRFQLTGLGFKLIDVTPAFISFSLGFSHGVIYYFKENLFVLRTNRQKQSFKIFGLDLSASTLLAGVIKRLKSPDIYKGKGLRFHKEKLKLRKREKFSR